MSELYDELGGVDGVRAAVTVLYRRVLEDPELAPWFVGIELDRLVAHQRAFLAAAFGGPRTFDGRDIAAVHGGMAITDDAFERIVTTLLIALDDLGVDREAVSRVGDRLEVLRGEIVTA